MADFRQANAEVFIAEIREIDVIVEPLAGELGRKVAGNNYFPRGVSGFYLSGCSQNGSGFSGFLLVAPGRISIL